VGERVKRKGKEEKGKERKRGVVLHTVKSKV